MNAKWSMSKLESKHIHDLEVVMLVSCQVVQDALSIHSSVSGVHVPGAGRSAKPQSANCEFSRTLSNHSPLQNTNPILLHVTTSPGSSFNQYVPIFCHCSPAEARRDLPNAFASRGFHRCVCRLIVLSVLKVLSVIRPACPALHFWKTNVPKVQALPLDRWTH